MANLYDDEKEQDKTSMRVTPENALDYNMMMIESVWGKADNISPELWEKLNLTKGVYTDREGKPITDDKGNYQFNIENLWATLGMYTRDMRLSNLTNKQFDYCVHYTDLAGDMLRIGMIEPFVVCLQRVATQLELSQSRGGFLRNRQNTLTSEQRIHQFEPPRRSVLSGKEINQGGQ